MNHLSGQFILIDSLRVLFIYFDKNIADPNILIQSTKKNPILHVLLLGFENNIIVSLCTHCRPIISITELSVRIADLWCQRLFLNFSYVCHLHTMSCPKCPVFLLILPLLPVLPLVFAFIIPHSVCSLKNPERKKTKTFYKYM